MSATQTVFMFSGQGSQYFQMGRQLFDTDDVFRQWMQRLDALAQKHAGQSVLEAIYSGSKAQTFDRTLLTHPAIFMVEYSLAQSLMRAGVQPDLTLGASLGSFAAAAVAGFLDVEDAMLAVLQQASTFEARCERGGMIAIVDDPSLFCAPFLSGSADLAGINFGSHFAVSTRQEHIDSIVAELRQRNVTHQRLAVSFAFHSRWIDQVRAPFESFMRSIPRSRGRLPLVCCDQAVPLLDLPEDFFWRVVRQPMRLPDTLANLEIKGDYRYIDVGPSGTMATFVKYGLPSTSRSTAHAVLTPFGQDQKNFTAVIRNSLSPIAS